MAKQSPGNAESRKAAVEKLRKQQRNAERRRQLIVVGACLAVGGGIIGFAAIQYQEAKDREARELKEIGVAASAAGCGEVITKDAEGTGQHESPGTAIEYPDAPPAFGAHWGNFLTGSEIRNFYTSGDRPEVERLVHSLEHGYTLLWYSPELEQDAAEFDELKSLARKFPVGERLMIVPWTEADGKTFPDDTRLAYTHWTGPENQKGVWQYCEKVSGEVAGDFTGKYTPGNSPEPGAV